MTPQQYCRKVCRQSGSNFVKTFRFLPRKRRLGFEAFYAFCRLVDDSVDEARSESEAEHALKEWSQEIDRFYHNTSEHPVGQALALAIHEFQIPEEYLRAIIAGCQMDLEKQRYATFEELKTYCYHVASCVGLVSLHLFGATMTEQTKQAAIELGLAVQLTNILRDIRPDLEQGRIYLPQEDLKKFQVQEDDLNNGWQGASAVPEQQRLLSLIRFEVDRARSLYHQAWSKFPPDRTERRHLLTAMMMGKIYEGLLDKIEADPMRVFREKVRLTARHKFAVISRVISQLYLRPWNSNRY